MAGPMTITEKILARACGQESVQAGDFVNARLDLALANDITAPLAIKEFEAAGMTKVWDPEKVVLVCDHFVPNKDIKSAEQAKLVRDFARRQGLTNFFDVGRMGIEHVILPEKGLVVPGDVVVGAFRTNFAKEIITWSNDLGFSEAELIRRPILGGYARLRYEYIILLHK